MTKTENIPTPLVDGRALWYVRSICPVAWAKDSSGAEAALPIEEARQLERDLILTRTERDEALLLAKVRDEMVAESAQAKYEMQVQLNKELSTLRAENASLKATQETLVRLLGRLEDDYDHEWPHETESDTVHRTTMLTWIRESLATLNAKEGK